MAKVLSVPKQRRLRTFHFRDGNVLLSLPSQAMRCLAEASRELGPDAPRKRITKRAQEASDLLEGKGGKTKDRKWGRYGSGARQVPQVLRSEHGHDPEFVSAAERWLFHGEDPPGAMVSPREAEILAEWMDYNAAGRRRQSRPSYGPARALDQNASYPSWLKLYPAPDVDQLYQWVAWQFGGPAPAGWFVITEPMIRVRREHSFDQRCMRAKALRQNVQSALSVGGVGEIVQNAIDGGSRFRAAGSLEKFPEWHSLERQRKDMLWRYIEKSRQESMYGYAGTATSQKTLWLKTAKDAGGDDCNAALRVYLEGGKLPTWVDVRSIGVIAPGLFLPSAVMLKFREVSDAVAVSLEARSVLNKLEKRTSKRCVEMLVLHLALPRPEQNGRPRWRLVFDKARGGPAARGGLPAEFLAAAKTKCRNETEENIVEAVGENTLTADEIAPVAGYPNNSYFRGKLSELVKRGVLEKPRRNAGYRISRAT